jgi:hypothetical protein
MIQTENIVYVSQGIADAVLSTVYNPEHIYLSQIAYSDGSLAAKATWFTPECYRNEPEHLTRIQIVSYLGQAAYALGGFLAENSLLPGLDSEEYLRLIAHDRATFRRLSLEFRRFISRKDSIALSVRCARRADGSPQIRRLRNLIFIPLLFDLEHGDCSGESEAILITDHDHA